jgi:hypothetical protein
MHKIKITKNNMALPGIDVATGPFGSVKPS